MKRPVKTLLIAVCAALPFFAVSAHAQTTRASCEADAKAQNIVGAERTIFMKACLPPGESVDKPAAKATKATKGKKAKAKKPVKAKKVVKK